MNINLFELLKSQSIYWYFPNLGLNPEVVIDYWYFVVCEDDVQLDPVHVLKGLIEGEHRDFRNNGFRHMLQFALQRTRVQITRVKFARPSPAVSKPDQLAYLQLKNGVL